MYHLTVTVETVACSLAASYCHKVISSCVGWKGLKDLFIRVICRKFPALAVNRTSARQ